MTDYKLVPMEPTEEMIDAAREHHEGEAYLPVSVYKAMLAAAPAVQGETVGWQFYQDGKWWNGDDRIKDHRKNTEEAGFRVRDVYVAPQPAERQSINPGLALDAANHLTNWLEMDICECEGGHYCGYTEVKRTRDALLEAAEQQPAPDVSGLVEALELIAESCDVGRHDGLPEEGPALCAAESWLIAKDALAAYRKQGVQS